MSEVTFKVGDIVALKSGGPAMTISGPEMADGFYPVIWFTGGVLRDEAFPLGTLKKT